MDILKLVLSIVVGAFLFCVLMNVMGGKKYLFGNKIRETVCLVRRILKHS